jgi:hypothetical protein
MFCKTTFVTAVIIVGLASAMTATNAADRQSGNTSITRGDGGEPQRSVPAICSRPPWIQRHRRADMRD